LPRPTQRAAFATGILGLLVVGAATLGLCVGSTPIAVDAVVGALFAGGDTSDPVGIIVHKVRLPSVLLALLVGGLLGVGGASTQALLRNPLADPYILGVSGGAALAVSIVITVGATAALGAATIPLAAFAGAGIAVGVLYMVASALPGGLTSASATYTLLLGGVIFNALTGAVIVLLFTLLSPERSHELILWMIGSISPSRAAGGGLIVCAVAGGLASIALISYAQRLNVLALGDTEAAAFGVDPGRTRAHVFFFASVAVGCAVAYAGPVGFVGLVVPHLLRLALGGDQRRIIPGSLLAGAAFLCLADAFARALFPVAGTTVPVGAVTALIGAPLFFGLLVAGLRRERVP